jgi:hypothetical protein
VSPLVHLGGFVPPFVPFFVPLFVSKKTKIADFKNLFIKITLLNLFIQFFQPPLVRLGGFVSLFVPPLVRLGGFVAKKTKIADFKNTRFKN